ncbi:glycyl-radical enzyme activating protein [Candidatus Bathyarchaeota archaeon]|nr:glycyl-radical enzyme activating protein [Candidatus Bathyarchaeota archaeon]
MGLVFDIQHYAIHDGPGIRTIVFLKGCPLDCPWCHNPESKSPKIEFMWWSDKCIGCKACIMACPNDAIIFNPGLKINEAKCNYCEKCINECYSEALMIVGKDMTVNEVMNEIEKDIPFYEESGGGVTFSGGEPLLQPVFLNNLLKECKNHKIHTAIETCGYANPETILTIKENVDLFLYDIKFMNGKLHETYTGVSNKLILRNLKLLRDKNVIIRVPLIPGVNDDFEQMEILGDFVFNLGFKEVHILPYHKAGIEKLKRLNISKTPFHITKTLSEELINKIEELLVKYNLKVKIGG